MAPQQTLRKHFAQPKIFEALSQRRPLLWLNRPLEDDGTISSVKRARTEETKEMCLNTQDLKEGGEDRWDRLAPLIKNLWPKDAPDGRIASELLPMKLQLGLGARARSFLKMDSELPVCASIKARGGLFEVLCQAESVAETRGLLLPHDSRERLATDPKIQACLAEEEVAVGSTGNLGMSVGLAAAALGMRATVHMSVDAKAWKKELLRRQGVNVVEHAGLYCEAVAAGRKAADLDPHCHFIDDEASKTLFLGYSAAARELHEQLNEMNITVSQSEPLIVYIPCGVGGAPGGIAWGLHKYFGEAVHIFFAEPVGAPCVTLGLSSKLHDKISVQDLGIDGKTEADGLAVSRASGLACSMVEHFLTGCFTVTDNELFEALGALAEADGRFIEPSCCAGLLGPRRLRSDAGASELLEKGTHVFWATGGALVPEEDRAIFRARSKEVRDASAVGQLL